MSSHRTLCYASPPFFYSFGHHRDLHSFPTRRSSDLISPGGVVPGYTPHTSSRSCALRLERTSPGAKLANITAVDRKSTRLNSSHLGISYAVFCLKKKKDRGDQDEEEYSDAYIDPMTV